VRHTQTIAEHWKDVLAATTGGTHQPRTAPIREALAEAIRTRDALERAEKTPLARGASPAPGNLDAVQLCLDIEQAVLHVERETRLAIGLTLWPRPAGNPLTVPAACSDINVLTRLCDHAQTTWIDRELAPVARAVLNAVGLDDRTITLSQPCPWCGGHLRVHAVSDLGAHVLCAGTQPCDAPSSTLLRGRPLWHWEHLDRLGAALLTTASAA